MTVCMHLNFGGDRIIRILFSEYCIRHNCIMLHQMHLYCFMISCLQQIYTHTDPYCIVLYLFIYIPLLSALAFRKRSRLQHCYCVVVNTPKRYRQLQVPSEGYVQGPDMYVAASMRFEPATLRTDGIEHPY